MLHPLPFPPSRNTVTPVPLLSQSPPRLLQSPVLAPCSYRDTTPEDPQKLHLRSSTVKYSVEIVIDRPIGAVLQLFEEAQSRPCWQRGLQSQKLISGQPNQVGSRTRLVFQMGKRRIEMIETITNRRLPYEYDGTYEAQGVFNSVRNRFTAMSGAGTQWVCESDFRFSGLFMKFIGLVFRKSFPAQTLQHMQDFKAYIEQGTDVRHTT